MNNNKDRLNSLIRLLGKPDQIFDNKNQKLDFVFKDIENLFKTIFTEQKNKIMQYTQKLTPPKVLINNLDSKIHLLDTRFNNYLENVITSKGTKLNSLSQLLEASSFNRVLDRGFVLVMDNDGKAIKLSSEVAKNSNVKIRFVDETRSAKID
jgi:exodeoxyribonuclease VII large subunit